MRLGVGEGHGTSAVGSDAWAWATDSALWLSRGPMGGRPVYMAQRGNMVFAGTVLEHVRQAVGAQTLCDEYLASRLTWAFSPEPRTTLYDGVLALAPRDVVRIDAGGIHWLRRDVPEVLSAAASGRSAEEFLWSNVVEAVGRALNGAKRPAFMLSGGLDSTGVIAAASELGRLSDASCFPHWHFDGPCPDSPYAQMVAQHFGVTPMLRSSAHWPEAWPRALTLAGRPFGLLCGAPESDSLRAAVAAGADVLLTGVGGDESLGGLTQGILQDPSVSRPAAMLRIAKLRMSWPTGVFERVMHYAVRPMLRAYTPSVLRARLRAREERAHVPWLGEAARTYLAHTMREESRRSYDLRSARGRYERMSETPALSAFAELRAQTEDDAGILRHDPLFDDRLVAAIASISPYTLYSDDRHRGLYRRSLAGRVPAMVPARRDKAYFEHAIGHAWRRARANPAFDDLAQGRRMAKRGLVSGAAFATATRALWSEESAYPLGLRLAHFWPAFAVEQFLAEHGE